MIYFHDGTRSGQRTVVTETRGDALEFADLVVDGLVHGRCAHVKGGLHEEPDMGPKRIRFKPLQDQV